MVPDLLLCSSGRRHPCDSRPLRGREHEKELGLIFPILKLWLGRIFCKYALIRNNAEGQLIPLHQIGDRLHQLGTQEGIALHYAVYFSVLQCVKGV